MKDRTTSVGPFSFYRKVVYKSRTWLEAALE